MKVTKIEVEHLVKRLGGKRFPKSGSGLPTEDGTWDIFHIQLKVTKKSSYRLKKADLIKLVKHAIIWGQVPLFVIYFQKEKVYTVIYPLPEDREGSVLKVTKTIHPDGRGVITTDIPTHPVWKFEPCKDLKKTLTALKKTCSPLL